MGGLGFTDFWDMNSALLAKQAWRLIQDPRALWVTFHKSLYFPNGTFKEAGRKRGSSWVWKSFTPWKRYHFLILAGG